ncbi:MAG TPA: ABC transporter substrate-binding protein [Dehalococcoidales bacterium]|nr:ABC transporter substrate-binding protein [Dehalococcoidales bacterium]
MKRSLVLFVTSLLLVAFILSACAQATTPAQPTPTQPAVTTPAPTQPAVTTPSPTQPGATTPTPTRPVASPSPSPSPSPTAVTPKKGGTYTWQHNGGMTDINPAASGGTLINRNLLPCLEALVRLDEKGQLKGHLAESWEVSPDGLTLTFKLRPGIKFHDGTAFNAQAVKFNLEEAFKKGISGSAFLASVKSYDVIDDLTLRLNLSRFDFRVLFSLVGTNGVGLIASPTALQKPATPENRAQLHMVGTGPFIFDSWRRDDFVKYTRNPNYWQPGLPYLDAIVIRNVADTTVSIMAFQAGNANLVENIVPDDVVMLSAKGYNITFAGLRFYHHFYPSGGNPASQFADRRVREALIYAINKPQLINAIAGGIAGGHMPVDVFSVPGVPWHIDVKPREYNVQKAKDLLREAGYPSGFKTTLFTDVRLSPRIWAEVLQTSFREVGIIANIEMLDVPRFTDLSRTGWNGILMPGFPFAGSMTSLVGSLSLKAPDRISQFRPPGWDELFDRIFSVTDENERLRLLKQANQIIYDEANIIPYRSNSPPKVDDGTVRDPKYMIHFGGAVDVWWPEIFWLDKK